MRLEKWFRARRGGSASGVRTSSWPSWLCDGGVTIERGCPLEECSDELRKHQEMSVRDGSSALLAQICRGFATYFTDEKPEWSFILLRRTTQPCTPKI